MSEAVGSEEVRPEFIARAAARAAPILLAAHIALIIFSTVAMLTIVNRPPGPWLLQEPAATVMRLAWTLSGPLYVTLGALAALALLMSWLGAGRALALFASATAVSLGAELLGTATGLPFGDYHYSGLLGYRVLGRVPFPIPLSWFYMLTGCLVAVARRNPNSNDRSAWRWAAVGALYLVAWDVAMDPAMVHTGHWAWGRGDMFHAPGVPPVLAALFTAPAFYGMPLSNWLGWLLTATLIARVMLWIVPPTAVRRFVAPSRVPVVLYLANGIMPVALCLRDHLWWAAVLGASGMLAVSVRALLPMPSPRSSSALAESRPPVPA